MPEPLHRRRWTCVGLASAGGTNQRFDGPPPADSLLNHLPPYAWRGVQPPTPPRVLLSRSVFRIAGDGLCTFRRGKKVTVRSETQLTAMVHRRELMRRLPSR